MLSKLSEMEIATFASILHVYFDFSDFMYKTVNGRDRNDLIHSYQVYFKIYNIILNDCITCILYICIKYPLK